MISLKTLFMITHKKEKSLVNSLLIELFPIFRSISGEGILKTISIIKKHIKLEVLKFTSGTKINDWVVPLEWRIKDAFIITPSKKKICNIKENNLHVVNYSTPVNKRLDKEDLEKYLYSIPELPGAIPYITSYYKKRWGFCIAHSQRIKLERGRYSVLIDSSLKKGFIPVAESLIKGKSKKEILFASYICHPSMANDQLSGPLTLLLLYKRLVKRKNRRFSYRFVFMPETIGSICYLDKKFKQLKKNILGGCIVSLTGGSGPIVYRTSRQLNSLADNIVIRNLKQSKYLIEDFNPSKGNDQRQFCSPGYNLPIGSITHTKPKKTEEFHTSYDDLKFISKNNIIKITNFCEKLVDDYEKIKIYKNIKEFGEPFLSKYKLYPDVGKSSSINVLNEITRCIMWLLNLSDGRKDLQMISERSKIPIEKLDKAAQICLKKKIIKEI